ncbi:SusC/RagA family TonB-linked outer membrane protein [Persicitalea jodogahamensis]|uniref:SusC/RagA family TonB-linked outer membrane protein n=1 Tax=Persicitalea jodogahamensis TaxID=402147 RepID=A0A8J3GBH1_9BACT|nr:SusC/RagA family TonB-linked outer membrane protein [Persicitalea jodogahamensis]
MAVPTAFAQNSVRGTVTAEGEPLPGVSVVVKGTTQGTTTDVEGKFTIAVAPNATLVFSYVGYQTKEIAVGNQTNLTVQLAPDNQVLNEVIVIGYGQQSRRDVTGSVSSVNEQVMKSVPRTNAATLLQGTAAGIRVQQSTGQPGATPRVVLRGGTSFGGGGEPLYVVDGVIVPSLYGINPSDIESMDVLKDAASLAIYGARAGNGVVLVTTKRGRQGRTQVTYTYRNATNYVRRNGLQYLSAEDYIRWNRIGLRNRFLLAQADNNTSEMNNTRNQLNGSWGFAANSSFTRSNGLYSTQNVTNANRNLIGDPMWNLLVDQNPFNPSQTDSLLYRATSQRELEDLILQRSSLQEHYVNFSGGNEQGNFALGLGGIQDVGILIGSDLKRFNMNFNGGLNVGKNLKITTNLAAYSTNGNPSYLAGNDGIIQRFAGIAPTVRLTDDITGEILPGVDGSTLGNPRYLNGKFIRTTQEQRFSGSVNLTYSLTDHLKVLATGSGFLRYRNAENFNKLYRNGTFGSVNSARASSFSNNRMEQYSYNGFLNYTRAFGKHGFDVLAGGEYFNNKAYDQSGSGIGSASDELPYLDNSIFIETRAGSGLDRWYRFASAIGRVNYNFDGRYLFNLNLRYDGTSQLTDPDNRYTLFPGISFGWNVHNEDFFRNSSVSDVVSTIKTRLSWGQNGTLESGDFGTVQQYYNLGLYNGIGAYGQTNLVNPRLNWEKTTTLNFGVDVGLLRNRLTVIADYFVRDVYDKLQSIAIPAWTGFSSYQTNLATLQNRGFELELRGSVLRPQDADGLSLDVSANISHVKTFAKKLLDNGLERNRQGAVRVFDPATNSYQWVGGLQEGYRAGLDEIYAPIFDGVYKTQGELDARANLLNTFLPTTNKRIKQLGDARWRDLDGNDTLDTRDFVYVGRTTPTIVGGFSTALGWKGLSLFGQFDYALGFISMNQIRMRGLSQVQGSQNSPVDIKNSWTPENPDADLPRYIWANYGRNYETGAGSGTPPANFWEKGNYLMMREVTLSYEVPARPLSTLLKDRIKGLKVYMTGSNLLYITKYSGTFPEEGGYDNGKYPLPRTLTLGVSATL